VRHEFEIYFWIRLSGLARNVDVKGLDKVFPETRKDRDGAARMIRLGRTGQNLYHRGHRGESTTHYVILSAANTSRSEVFAESKDPAPAECEIGVAGSSLQQLKAS